MNKEGVIQLHIAIIEQAHKDFMRLFRLRNDCRYRTEFKQLIRDIEGNTFKALLPVGITSEKVIEIWTQEAKEGGSNAISKNDV